MPLQTKKLGEGHFGIVFRGVAQGIVPGEDETEVAVKVMLSDQVAATYFDRCSLTPALMRERIS